MSMAMYFNAYYYLSVDVLIASLQIFSMCGNGTIILLFYLNKRLKQQQQLRLLLSLAITDFLFALLSIPYTVNFISGWNTQEFMYNGHLLVALAQPLVINFKVNLLIATGIAVDRLQAMCWPIYYRLKNSTRFLGIVIGTGLAFATVDMVIEYSMGVQKDVPDCNAIGCFVSHSFRLYWGISNMALNFVMLCLAIAVMYKFNKIRLRSKNVVATATDQRTAEEKKQQKNFTQTNRLSVSILIISIIFLLIPSTFVGVVDWFGMQTFERFGPFYLIGLLLAGVSNSVAYIVFHIDLRAAAMQLICRRQLQLQQQTTEPGTTNRNSQQQNYNNSTNVQT